jgi:formylglycine-generating enzyme
MKMLNLSKIFVPVAAIALLASCSKLGKGKAKGSLPNDGQVHGIGPGGTNSNSAKVGLAGKPYGMVYVPSGTFHMGPSDEDVNYAYTAKNKEVSINGFYIDATEITNNKYRQFTKWTIDSLGATALGYLKSDGSIDPVKLKTLKFDNKNVELIGQKLFVAPDSRIFNMNAIDPEKVVYQFEDYSLKEAAKRENKGQPLSNFIKKYPEKIYPDTLVWMRDFSYSYNEPMTRRYYNGNAYGNYPVVGVTWKQAEAFCNWRTRLLNTFLLSKKRGTESNFRLPFEAEWEYAARGGRSQSMFPWGNYYLRNKKGCLLANFKPGRGNYPEDGGMYTVRADAYWPNDYGIYNMAGNVAEWTSSWFNEGAYNFQHDMNPDIRYDAKESDPPRMKRKVIRGGSWKDVGNRLQCGARDYEYQDTAKSYIGFRCVIDLPAPAVRRK